MYTTIRDAGNYLRNGAAANKGAPSTVIEADHHPISYFLFFFWSI